MEKLKGYVDERYDSLAQFCLKIEQFKKNLNQSDQQNFNRIPTPSSINADYQNNDPSKTIIKDIVNLKRFEKRRIEQENTLLKQLSMEENNVSKDIYTFFEQSISTMRRIDESFYFFDQFNGCFDDISKLYKQFFKKQQEIKKYNETELIQQQSLFEKIPTFLILFKWLIEISRNRFERMLNQKNQELLLEVKITKKNMPTLYPIWKQIKEINNGIPKHDQVTK